MVLYGQNQLVDIHQLNWPGSMRVQREVQQREGVMDLSNALAAAEGQTVQPGDFNSGTQRTSAASPMASPQPAAPQPAPQPAAGQPVPQPAPAQPIGPRSGVPQPQPAAPSAGQPRGPAPASPSPGQPAMGAAASPAPAGPWTLRSQLQQIGFDTSQ